MLAAPLSPRWTGRGRTRSAAFRASPCVPLAEQYAAEGSHGSWWSERSASKPARRFHRCAHLGLSDREVAPAVEDGADGVTDDELCPCQRPTSPGDGRSCR